MAFVLINLCVLLLGGRAATVSRIADRSPICNAHFCQLSPSDNNSNFFCEEQEEEDNGDAGIRQQGGDPMNLVAAPRALPPVDCCENASLSPGYRAPATDKYILLRAIRV